jgi:UPF0755 protein
MKFLRRLLILLLLVVLPAGYVWLRLTGPYQGFQQQTFVEFPHGTGTEAMADMLAKAGVVRSPWDFLLARLVERGGVLKAGDYRFARPASPLEVYERIARGDTFYYTLLVPEGKNMFDIAASAAAFGLFSKEDFLAAARQPGIIRDLDPEAPSLEGYLFPDTYHLGRHTTAEGLCRLMTARFREIWKSLGSPAGAHRTVTLASLVEREGKLPEERPLIAAVFENRLRIGMKLDCDPTTIYAALLDHHYRGTIYRSDLESGNSYNTYRHAGLPPGPIANPGRASLEAALQPASSAALFFVLRPDGSNGHQFSNQMAEQSRAVARYRRALPK